MPAVENVPRSLRLASMQSPAESLVPVNGDDAIDLDPAPCRGLLVGTAGSADLIDASGVHRNGVPLQAGYNPIQVRRVKFSNLTASNIWALY